MSVILVQRGFCQTELDIGLFVLEMSLWCFEKNVRQIRKITFGSCSFFKM